MDNKCRKVGTATPGCFTTDPDTRWEECYCADPDQKHYNHISLGYTFAVNIWGNSFYKTYEEMNYLDAKAQCESDGAYLAIPRSDAENAFIASLIPNDNIWIGVNDIDEEGTFAAVDGQDVTYTKWNSGEPNHYEGNEDGFLMVGGTNGMWADKGIEHQEKLVCMSNIL